MTASFRELVIAVLPAQAGGSNLIVNGILFAALAGAAIFAVCRSSGRN